MKIIIFIVIYVMLILNLGCNNEKADNEYVLNGKIYDPPEIGEGFAVKRNLWIERYYREDTNYKRTSDIIDTIEENELCFYSAVELSDSQKNRILTRFVTENNNIVLKMTSDTFGALNDFTDKKISESPLVVKYETYQNRIGNVLGIMKISKTGGGPRTYYNQNMYYFDLETGNELTLDMLIKEEKREEFYTSIIEKVPPYYIIRFHDTSDDYFGSICNAIDYHPITEGLIFTHSQHSDDFKTFFISWESIESYIDTEGSFYRAIFAE